MTAKRISRLITSEAEAEVDRILLSWREHLLNREHLTPQTAVSLEAYHIAVGEYGAYELALEIITQYQPSTRQMARRHILDALQTERIKATRQYFQAYTEAEQWQSQGREATLRAIIAEWAA